MKSDAAVMQTHPTYSWLKYVRQLSGCIEIIVKYDIVHYFEIIFTFSNLPLEVADQKNLTAAHLKVQHLSCNGDFFNVFDLLNEGQADGQKLAG